MLYLSMSKCQGDTFGWIERESKVNCCSFNALDGVLMVCCIGVNDGEVISKTFALMFKTLDILGALVCSSILRLRWRRLI